MLLSSSNRSVSSTLCACLTVTARAAVPAADCGADGHVPCALSSALRWLDALAVLLAIVLVVVGVLAWQAYKRNRQNDPLSAAERRSRRR